MKLCFAYSLFVLLSVAATAAGCTKTSELFCDENTPCTDPARPFCDLNGDFEESEGHGRTCIANPFDAGVAACEPSTTQCQGDEVIECDVNGNIVTTTPCPLGCSAAEPRCNKLDPSNGHAEFLDMAETGPDIILADGAVINTTDGTVINGDASSVDIPSVLLPAPIGGVEVRVFMVKSIIFGDTSITGTPAIALMSAGDVDVHGDVILYGTAGLPGRYDDTGNPCHGPPPAPGQRRAGGGGGFGTPGGRGGTAAETGGDGGSSSGNEQLVPLRGGCRGGSTCTTGGGIICATERLGAPAGGGAVQVSSASAIRIGDQTNNGSIEAHGHGQTTCGADCFPRGGGSGGAVLLEAPVVEIHDRVGANGGGGSCADGPAGDGTIPATANGADCSSSANGDGGNGGHSGATPTNGENVAANAAAGGGGGATGRIRINSAGGSIEGSGIASPTPSLGIVQTR